MKIIKVIKSFKLNNSLKIDYILLIVDRWKFGSFGGFSLVRILFFLDDLFI